jgi:hypothetical protein
MLECYRVVLFLRPPNLPLTSTSRLDYPERDTASSVEAADALVDILFTPGKSVDLQFDGPDSALALLMISITTYPVLPRRNPPLQAQSLWRTEYFELALSKWAMTQSSDTADWSLLTLYHLTFISLYTAIGLIQRLVHGHIGSQASGRAARKFSCLDGWRRGRHYLAAKWHAQRILALVKDAFAATDVPDRCVNDDAFIDGKATASRHAIVAEPPHLPYSVYIATLVLWCGDHAPHLPEREAGAVLLENSERLLARMRVRVAGLLQRNLGRLRR